MKLKKSLTQQRRHRLLRMDPPIQKEDLWRPEPIAPPVDNLPLYDRESAEVAARLRPPSE